MNENTGRFIVKTFTKNCLFYLAIAEVTSPATIAQGVSHMKSPTTAIRKLISLILPTMIQFNIHEVLFLQKKRWIK
ncbi:MAG: hypothetical protein CVT99_03165 [Bacteroidetes bacterium HGW-Bacteroidetes-16]|nr:MAG: hypothetical protein CVT99_03165 [Bacteroidetes bacterium HGW-Bacteroidetes-16]